MKRTPNPVWPALPRIGALVLLAAALGACGKGGGGAGGHGQMPPPPAVNVSTVVQKEVTLWDEFTGRIEAVDRVEVRPRVTGYLDKTNFVEGHIVKKGDVLFQIDDREYRAAHGRALADIERAKARVLLAKRQLERSQQLVQSKLIPRSDVDTREAELTQAQADQASSQAAAEQTRLNVEFTRVIAPIDGRVSKALVTPGNLVSSNAPTPTLLTTVVSIDPVYVSFEGDEQTYLRYQGLARDGSRPSSRDAKNPVRVGLADEDGYPHEGVMQFVDNEVDSNTGTIRARAVLENKDGLFTPGLFARVRLLASGKQNVMLINDRAVMTDQDRKFVYVLGPDNKALRKDVKLGPQVEGLRVVTDGLAANDTVLVNGLQKVFFPGMPVQPNPVPMDKPEQAPPPPPGAPAQAQGAH